MNYYGVSFINIYYLIFHKFLSTYLLKLQHRMFNGVMIAKVLKNGNEDKQVFQLLMRVCVNFFLQVGCTTEFA